MDNFRYQSEFPFQFRGLFVQFPISLENKNKGLTQHLTAVTKHNSNAFSRCTLFRMDNSTNYISGFIFIKWDEVFNLVCRQTVCQLNQDPRVFRNCTAAGRATAQELKLLTVSTRKVTPSTSVPIVDCAATVFALSISPLAECDVISPTDCSTPLSLAQIWYLLLAFFSAPIGRVVTERDRDILCFQQNCQRRCETSLCHWNASNAAGVVRSWYSKSFVSLCLHLRIKCFHFTPFLVCRLPLFLPEQCEKQVGDIHTPNSLRLTHFNNLFSSVWSTGAVRSLEGHIPWCISLSATLRAFSGQCKKHKTVYNCYFTYLINCNIGFYQFHWLWTDCENVEWYKSKVRCNKYFRAAIGTFSSAFFFCTM